MCICFKVTDTVRKSIFVNITNMQKCMYYLKSFHKKHHTFMYEVWVAGNNSEAIWKTRFQYNMGNSIKM